jgi:uncharacterized protein YunC (DUF1805 family)
MSMLKSEVVKVDGESLLGIEVATPNAPILMLVGHKGLVGCGYFRIEAADKVGHALAVVSGVRSIPDVLAGKVTAVSRLAEQAGVKPGMTGAEAAARLA